MAETPQRAICLCFQTAIQVLRALSISDAPIIERYSARTPLPLAPPQCSDLEHAFEQLESLGLLRDLIQPLHVLTGSPARCRPSNRCHPHVCSKPLPPASFFTAAQDLLCTKPALAFVQAATFLSLPALLALGYEWCGTYRKDPRSDNSVFQLKPLVSCAELRAFVRKHSFLRGSKLATKALAYLADGSASPRETQIAILFALPRCYGGYGLGVPTMNYEVRATAKARSISNRSSFRCDLCWPHARLDVEYQSREFHEGESSRIRDSRRANALMSMGFNLIAITNDELESPWAVDVIASTIAKAIGKKLRKEPADHLLRKMQLRKELGLPI